MQNGIIIPMLIVMVVKSLTKRYILQLTKCEHKGFSESIDSYDRNFFCVKLQQIFKFL